MFNSFAITKGMFIINPDFGRPIKWNEKKISTCKIAVVLYVEINNRL
jgi:hypothetical protein